MQYRLQNLTPEILMKNGYKEFPPSPLNSCDKIYQKKFKDEKGIKYFITYNLYKEDMEVTMQLQHHLFYSNIRFFALDENTNIETIEMFVESLWHTYGENYYEEYESQK